MIRPARRKVIQYKTIGQRIRERRLFSSRVRSERSPGAPARLVG
jgi:hypothetical protein